MIANLLLSVLIGAIYFLAGLFMKFKPPTKINALYGYRTHRSMKNEVLWKEGNAYCADLMIKYGIVMGLVGAIISLLIKNELAAVFVVLSLMIGLIVLMFIHVEKRLKEMEK